MVDLKALLKADMLVDYLDVLMVVNMVELMG